MRAFFVAVMALPVVISGLGSSAPAAQQPPPAAIVTLEALKDHYRPLLVFASRPDDPQLEIQIRTLNEHAAAAADRDLVAIGIPYANPSPTPASLSPADAAATRRRFNVAPADFTVILIGKDGGEKLRSRHPLSIDKLSEAIDAMPMRQQETRGQTPHWRRHSLGAATAHGSLKEQPPARGQGVLKLE